MVLLNQARHNKAISRDTWSQLLEFARVNIPVRILLSVSIFCSSFSTSWKPENIHIQLLTIMDISLCINADSGSGIIKLWSRRGLAISDRRICGLLGWKWRISEGQVDWLDLPTLTHSSACVFNFLLVFPLDWLCKIQEPKKKKKRKTKKRRSSCNCVENCGVS